MFSQAHGRPLAAILFAAVLAGCAGIANQPGAGQPTVAPQPTSKPQATAQPTSAAQPTAAGQATVAPQPSSIPHPTSKPQATAQPNPQPAFAFDPRAGGAGVQININGWGFAPGSEIAVRLGNPQPIGEALTSTRADAAGRWASSFTMPSNLTYGQPIPAGDIGIVVMDASTTQPLASAPFSFQAASAPTRDQATQTVASLLHAVGTPEAWGYLASNLDHNLPVEQSLGLKHHWVTYDVGAPLDRASEVLFVPATLTGDTQRHRYEFTLVVEQGQWRINGASWISSEPLAPAPEEPAASRPGTYDYSNIATVMLRGLRQERPNQPVVVGAVAVAGTYAAAYALPYGDGKQFSFLRQAAGAGWEVVLATGVPTPDMLARAGIPRSLLALGPVPAIMDTLIAYYNRPSSGGSDGWVSVDAIDGGYARATLHRNLDGDLTIYLRGSGDSWERLIDGQIFAPEALDDLGIPASLR